MITETIQNPDGVKIPQNMILKEDPLLNLPSEKLFCNIPPKLLKRNQWGLLENFDYKFTPEGLIDWRALISKEHLYINSQNKERIEKKYGKKYEELDIENDKIEDRDLVSLLLGLKILAQIRGYKSIEYKVNKAQEDYVCVTARILWKGNFETENEDIIFESIASATISNTQSFARLYLSEISENRALSRNIRNFLKIGIVSREEIFDSKSLEDSSQLNNNNNNISPLSPVSILRNIMIDNVWSFDQIKKKLVKEGIEGAEKWQKEEDLPPNVILNIIERIKNKEKKDKKE